MASRVSAINVELVEQYESEKDVGDFHSLPSTLMPIYYTHRGSVDVVRKRGRTATSNRRLITKSGKPNLSRHNNPLRRIAYIRDIGNTLVNSRWKWTLLSFASSYVICWLVFAVLYMIVARDNGDSVNTSCFLGIVGFAGYFLLSLETQQTIGYGTRYITSNCMEAVFLISLQMITSIAICGAMTTIVYTKMVSPRSWKTTALFSKVAVINQRDGQLCLIFRVRDDENKHGSATAISAYLVQTRMNEPCLKSLTLENPGLLLWPLEVVHKITATSPFWDLSAKDLIAYKFELVVMLQGTSIITGHCSKARSSYLANEILWGHRFKPCVRFDVDKNSYFVDHSQFNKTEEVLTPLCSAQRLDEVLEEITTPLTTPIHYRSPAVSARYNMYQDDQESSAASSGIGSWKDEQLSPALSVVAKKLSTIRELNSTESIAPEADFSNFKSDVSNNVKEMQSGPGLKFKNSQKTSTSKHGELDIESLLAGLQSYLDENSNAKSNTYKFCETDF